MSEAKGFEEALDHLENRVRKLEAGDISLDEALVLFEEGVSLARTCHEHLDAAEERVSALTRGATEIQHSPLDEPSS